MKKMANISAKDVKALREETGAGMMDCKNALKDAEGDPKKAVELLRERGLSKAGKRAGRATSEGTVGFAIAGADACHRGAGLRDRLRGQDRRLPEPRPAGRRGGGQRRQHRRQREGPGGQAR